VDYSRLVSADEVDVLVWPIGSDTRLVKSSGDAVTSGYGTKLTCRGNRRMSGVEGMSGLAANAA
jgi:hypothetical protein